MSHGAIVWFTGLPASGKSTLARHVRDRLAATRPCVVLDSDELRDVLGATSYDRESRAQFYRSLRALASLLAAQGLVVLVAATAPLREHRSFDRSTPRVIEVYLATSLDVCEARDPKGLYAAARRHETRTLPGVGEPYEAPLAPTLVASGGEDARAVDALVEMLGSTSS